MGVEPATLLCCYPDIQAGLIIGVGHQVHDTQPPDAHFFADLCGFAFFGKNDACIFYREGKTFGSGIVHNSIRVVVRDTRVWVSKAKLPKNCKCP